MIIPDSPVIQRLSSCLVLVEVVANILLVKSQAGDEGRVEEMNQKKEYHGGKE